MDTGDRAGASPEGHREGWARGYRSGGAGAGPGWAHGVRSRSIGENIQLLVDRPDGTYCFRLHRDRVYYLR